MSPKYEVVIFWSVADNCFVAEVPELIGCSAHGDSYESALANIEDAMQFWLDTACEDGLQIPAPKGRRLQFA